MRTSAAIGLLLAALSTGVWAAESDEGFSISYFTCNETWNPSCPSNRKVPIQSMCNLKLRVTSLRNESEAGSGETVAALVSLLVTAGLETLRARHVIGVDYFLVASKDVRLSLNGTTEIDLSQLMLTMPNKCGQTYLIVRLAFNDVRQDQAIPIRLQCPEKTADLALIGDSTESYDMYNQRAVLHVNGQPITYAIKGLKLLVKNVGNETFSPRTGPSSILVVAYIKTQKWYMYEWGVENQSESTVAHVDRALLEFELGDELISQGMGMLGLEGGRGSPSLAPGYQLELHTEQLLLRSKSVCGNAVMVLKLDTCNEPNDLNKANNYLIYPIFVDCWGHNPVQSVENCDVIPNFYDGGQTAFITYAEAGQLTAYEYKSSDKSIRQLKDEEDQRTMKEVAAMKLQVDVHSNRLLQLGQCVDSLWGSSDSVVTEVDVLLTDVRKCWDEVRPENKLQSAQHGKIKLIMDTLCDLVALMLQPSNPLHEFLHVPFAAYFNPYYSYVNSYYDNSVNRVKRDVTPSSDNDTTSQSLNVPTTSSPPVTSSDHTTRSDSSAGTYSTRSDNSAGTYSTGSDSSAGTYSTGNSNSAGTYSTESDSSAGPYSTGSEKIAGTYSTGNGNSAGTYSTGSDSSAGTYSTGSDSSAGTYSSRNDNSAGTYSTGSEKSTGSSGTYSTPTGSWERNQSVSTQDKSTVSVTQTLTGTQTSHTETYEEPDEDTAFGPQHQFHRTCSDWVNDIVQNGGQNHQVLSPERWHVLSNMAKAFFYGNDEDLKKFQYIPAITRQNVVKIFSMINRLQLPRFFDNIPIALFQQVKDWLNEKWMRTRNFGSAACDYEEGFSLALNVTQQLMRWDNMTRYADQLKLLSYVIDTLLQGDHCEYFARLYYKLVSADQLRHTWMMRDGIPIHEPSREDVCKRSTAVKLWQLKECPVFQFASRTMSPDHYTSVFWEKDQGTILRGDRSDITGQVFWTKVATCSCPNGSTCTQSNTQSPPTQPKGGSGASEMRAAPMMKSEAASVHLKPVAEHELDEAEDLIFSN